MVWVNAIVQGILLGGLYALFAAGLSLMFGVMRFINMAHGDFIVTAAYLMLALVTGLALPPLAACLLVVAAMAAAGYLNQRLLLNRVLGKDILPPVLVTFGMSIILQNALLEIFSADSQKINAGRLDTASLQIGGDLAIGALPMLMFAAAVAVIAALEFVFYRTATGRLLRATSDDPEIVPLMGGNNAHIFALATALASVVVAIAGIFMAMKTNFDPAAGPVRLLLAFEVVIIGGLGSLWGTLAGGIILGIAQTVGARFDAGSQMLFGHLVFLCLIVLRPRGLFPRM